MKWEFRPALELADDIRACWGAVNQASSHHLLLDPIFVAALVRHFAAPTVFFGVMNNGAGGGVVLVERTGRGVWQTFQPSQAPLGLVAFSNVAPISEQRERFLAMLRSLPGYALQLGIMQQDPKVAPAPMPHPNFEEIGHIQTGRLLVDVPFEQYWESRSDDLKDNLKRRLRRLQKGDHIAELLTRTRPDEMAAALHEYSRIESAGWKGKSGTAIEENSPQGHFYRQILEEFSLRGEAVVFELRLNGTVVGSELYLLRNRILIGLKTTYDESYKVHSPGFLMKYYIVRKVFKENLADAIEFYGRVVEWQLKWIADTRWIYHLNCYRQPWIQKAKTWIKKMRGIDRTKELEPNVAQSSSEPSD